MAQLNRWQGIIGHRQLLQDLQLLLAQQKLPHALLLAGMEGIGKKLIAQMLAKFLLCKTQTGTDDCVSCRTFAAGSHPDYYYLQPEGKVVKMIKIEQIRKLQEGIALSPYLSDKRVVIIDGAEYMNEVAANSLLKTLEEPVGQVYFILLTANKDMLLTTILSRCMKLYVAPLSVGEVAHILVAKHSIQEQRAEVLARLSGGSVSKALQFWQEDSLSLRTMAVEFLTADIDARKIWSLSDTLGSMDRDKAVQWSSYLQMLLRDVLIVDTADMSDTVGRDLLYNSDIYEQLCALKSKFTVEQLFGRLKLVNDFGKRLNSNADVKLMLQNFMLQWKNEDKLN